MGNAVWLASYPKSGNTWFRAVHAACRDGDLDLNDLGSSASSFSRGRLDRALGISSSLLTDEETDAIRPMADEVIDAAETSPYLVKLHDGLRTAGIHRGIIVSPAATRCAIYVLRDPRDVAVSYAHHDSVDIAVRVADMSDPSFEVFRPASGSGAQVRQRLGTWSEHVLGWIDHAPFPVHVVRYEDCLSNPVVTFETAMGAAGFEVDRERIIAAVEMTSFDRLRSQEAQSGFRERPQASTAFFRRGVAGGWRDELPDGLARRIETDHAHVMERFGYLP